MSRTPHDTVRRATRWSGLEIGIRYALQFGVMIALARLVDPAAFGVVAMVMVFTALGTVFVDSGTGMALIQRQHTTDDEETSTFVVNLAISMVACIALIACATPIAAFYGRPELVPLCIALSIVFPLNGLAVVPDALLTQRLRFELRTRVELGSSLLAGVVAVGSAWMGWGVWALVWQAIVSIGSRTAMLYLVSGWRPRGRFRGRAARSITSFGGYMLAAGLIDTAYTRLQSVLIGRLFSAVDLGQYTLALNTQQAPASFAAAILNRLGLPLLSSVKSDLTEARRTLRTALRLSLFAFIPAMAVLTVLAVPIVRIVYGVRWAPAGELLAILALGAVPWPAHVLNLVAMNSQGRPRLVFRVEVVKKTIAVTLLLAAAPFGLVAIAWSTVATSFIALALNAYFVGRIMGHGIPQQAADIGMSAVPALGAAGAALLCRLTFGEGLGGTTAGLLAAGLATVAIGTAIRHPAISGFIQLIRTTRHVS
jgi:O-antigen/teichoic acid export membrane protein